MQPRLPDMPCLVEQQRDLAMALDARNRVDGDAAQAGGGKGRGVDGGVHGGGSGLGGLVARIVGRIV